MKYVVVKIPDNEGVISKSAKFFDNIEEAVLYQQDTPYNTVVAFVEDGGSWPVRFMRWLEQWTNPNDGTKKSTV